MVLPTTPGIFEGVLIYRPIKHSDDRGFFKELYRSTCGLPQAFVQDNLSLSSRSVIRGLHYQDRYEQGKLINVIKGSVYDVIVDLRPHSKTYRQWWSILLDDAEGLQLYVPPGCAHGFQSLCDNTYVLYKCTELWHPEYERTIAWNDKELNINWPIADPIVSGKDEMGMSMHDAIEMIKGS